MSGYWALLGFFGKTELSCEVENFYLKDCQVEGVIFVKNPGILEDAASFRNAWM